jgi:hypothetical protein
MVQVMSVWIETLPYQVKVWTEITFKQCKFMRVKKISAQVSPCSCVAFQTASVDAKRQRKMQVLLDQQDRDTRLLQRLQRLDQLLHHDGRKAKRHFIDDQDFRRSRQPAPDRQQLLFAVGKNSGLPRRWLADVAATSYAGSGANLGGGLDFPNHWN